MKSLRWIGSIILCLWIAGPVWAVDEARQAYDKMVEEATQEADEYVQEKQEKMQEAKEKDRIKKDKELQQKIQTEREAILAQMEKVRQRGLSTTFTQGMKDNLLQRWQEQLDYLESNPEAYFAQKQ
ncbi:MAG: hypothetical protein PVG51_01890 [Desulfosarcina sp.]|jgi:vacuolar-type H+-ATPase subunit H